MLPILAALALQAMYGAVDALIVGRLGTNAGLSGVSTGSVLTNLLTMVITQFSMGNTVLIGRYSGEGHPEKLKKVVGGTIAIFAVFAAILFVIMAFFAQPLAILLQAPEEAVDATVSYIWICGCGIFFIVAYNVISSIFRGFGDSKMPLLFVAVACAANIAGDLFFVGVLKMDAAGAALATVLAQALSVVLSLIIIRKREFGIQMAFSDIGFNAESLNILRIGIPVAFCEFMTQVSFAALCAFINRLGLTASAGYGIASKIVSFSMLLPSSLMQTLAPIVSQNVGASNEKRAKSALKIGVMAGICAGTVIMFTLYFAGSILSGIFSPDPAVIARSAEYLKGYALEAVLVSIVFCFTGYFNGHEKTVFVMAQSLAMTFLIRLPISYVMSIRPNASLMMIGFAAPISTIFGILINIAYFFMRQRKDV